MGLFFGQKFVFIASRAQARYDIGSLSTYRLGRTLAMSDTLQTKHLQRLRQQRQILAMMGIGQWSQPESPTLNMAMIAEASAPDLPLSESSVSPVPDSPVSDSSIAETSRDLHAPASLDAVDDPRLTLEDANHAEVSLSNPVAFAPAGTEDHTPIDRISAPDIEQLVAPLVEKATAPVLAAADGRSRASTPANTNIDKVAPFDLQGGSFGEWVIMVDIQALDHDGQKLWHNITQALSITCERTSFPICAGMDSCELANASLAGYVFKLGRSESVSVAALTPLPNGVTHPNLVSVPTLAAMLQDSALKREFWQQISQPS